MFLLDTNVLAEIRKKDRAQRHVMAWASAVNPAHLYLSVMTIWEIETGARLKARTDAVQGAVLRTWIDRQVLPVFADRILVVDVAIVERCAELRVPQTHPHRDALIAATALVHRMTVVTRNVKDFAATGVTVLNPFEP